MHANLIVRSTIGLALGAASLATPSASAGVVMGTSHGYGLSSDLNLLQLVTLSVSPTASAQGTSPAPYDLSNSLLQLNATSVVLGSLETGLMVGTAGSNVDGLAGGRFASASGTVDGLAAGLLPGLLGSVLSINATTISASANVSGDVGALGAIGTSVFEDASLSYLGNNLAIIAAPAPNTILLSVAGLTITLNEQIMAGDGNFARSLTVNAIHISFSNFVFGTGLVNGDIIIGHAEASLAAVPSPGAAAALVMAACLSRSRRRSR